MVRNGWRWGLVALVLVGCFPEQEQTLLVPESPFGQAIPPGTTARSAQPNASLEVAARVDTVGRQLMSANPKLGLQPLFITIGAPQLEIFHRGTNELIITEGLVKQCASDAQLAAVLSLELGKMVTEREALAGAQARAPEPPPPMDVRIGNDNAGFFGPADQLHRAELARLDGERRQRRAAATPLDPQALAKRYLTQAGYPATELDAAAPLLKEANENRAFARQMLTTPPARPVQPAPAATNP